MNNVTHIVCSCGGIVEPVDTPEPIRQQYKWMPIEDLIVYKCTECKIQWTFFLDYPEVD